MTEVLSTRALNRATLERQLLLRRSDLGILDAVGHLVGLQAQVPLNPYLGLWSRLERFEPDALGQLLEDRQVVRIVVMRGTIHLVTADDCLVLRPLAQPVLDGELVRHSEFAPLLRGVELGPVIEFARSLLDGRPYSGPQLRAALGERFPDLDRAALAYACRNHLALVQVPPRGVWGKAAQVSSMTAEGWLGRPVATKPSIDEVMLRYLAAFGPATPADASTWSRLTGLREVFERLGPKLRRFKDESGRELFDLPDAPRPDPDTPAPPRFLPEYDNLVLSHNDRTRVIPKDDRWHTVSGPFHGSVLDDGFLAGSWWLDRDKATGSVVLNIRHLAGRTKRATAAIESEGQRVVRFLEPDAATHDVRLHLIR